MRFLTPEQALERLSKDANVNGVHFSNRDNRPGNNGKIPVEIKSMIHACGVTGMKMKDISELFDITPSTGYAIKKGNKQGADGQTIPDGELRSVVKKVEETIVDRAVALIEVALEASSGKINDKENKLRDITGAAKDFASIIEKIQPKQGGMNIGTVVVVGANPHNESRYQVIDVSAK